MRSSLSSRRTGSSSTGMVGMEGNVQRSLDAFLAVRGPELIAVRRDLHAHAEPGYAEYRTTSLVAERLTEAGLRPKVLPRGTGLLVDVGSGEPMTIPNERWLLSGPTSTPCRW